MDPRTRRRKAQRRSHRRLCSSKRAYPNRNAAYTSRRRQGRPELMIYQCLECRKYHLGGRLGSRVGRVLDRLKA